MSISQKRYEVIETLGTGATSRVDKARDTLIGRTVAVKTFLRGFGSRDLQQQFLREAQIIGGLSHPNIVALYDVGTNPDGAPYFVMEYVEGKTLEFFFDDAPLPLPRLAVWAGDLATALGQAHRAKIIHGDVKPANILVTSGHQVKLGDFGIARFSTQASGSENLLGTPAYLSPEQIVGHLQDSRSDLFSLGIVLYQMSTGIRPFDGDSVSAVCAQIISSTPPPPSHHNPSLPHAFDQVVMRCLAKSPDDRFSTAEELAASIYPFARTSHGAPPRSRSLVSQLARLSLRRWPLPRKDLLRAAAALVFIISTVSIVNAFRKHSVPTLTASAAMVDPSPVTSTRDTPFSPVSTSSVSIISSEVADSHPTDSRSPATNTDSPRTRTPTPSTSKTSRRAKPPTIPQQSSSLPIGPVPGASLGPPIVPASSADTQATRPKPLASLRVEIVSAIAEESLAVYSGQDVLVSARLDSAHLGQELHFDCPLSAGTHPLRVVLYHADDSLHLQKEGFAEIASDGSNTLEIRVNRRQKLLIRKQAALEINWPNSHATAAENTAPVAPASASSK